MHLANYPGKPPFVLCSFAHRSLDSLLTARCLPVGPCIAASSVSDVCTGPSSWLHTLILTHRTALLLFLIECDLAVAAFSSCSAICCHPLGFPQQARH